MAVTAKAKIPPKNENPKMSPRAKTMTILATKSQMGTETTNKASRTSTKPIVVSFPKNGRSCGFKRNFIAEPPFFALMPPVDSIFCSK